MPTVPDIYPFVRRVEELDAAMADPSFFADARKAAMLSREQQKLREMIDQHSELQKVDIEIKETQELLADSESDDELKELAEMELPDLKERKLVLEKTILIAMIPPNETDSRNTLMEIRAGAGGDEASLFAADLYRMYCRYAETKGWRVEQLSASLSDRNGFKEVIFAITGEDVYKLLKFESGVHRVQRVPDTEANGRIHTSTVTVAVLPEAEEVDITIDPSDLDISVCRASGPGGQGVNTTDSAVQILHKPTGMIVTCADERSQIKNRAKAMKVLRSRLLQIKEEEEKAKYSENRRSQIGSGDRSERIRTYNFPQSRLTDHRIGLTLHSLPQVIEGEIEEVIEALLQADYDEKVEELMNKRAF
ncbi:MAG: peptide chain release factor 1 [Opitutaceae bacterium]|nr:peptide chain release factor 1 [Opitutaceae bacterium]